MYKTLLLIVSVSIVIMTFGQSDALRKEHLNHKMGVAINGYDPVAYFTEGKAVKGSKENMLTHKGIAYCFSSTENKKAFLTNPEKYEPQYGGWCAFAMGDYGKKVEVNPETFKIADDKLFLFYNFYLNNTLKSWNKNEKNLQAKGDKNWTVIFAQ